MHGKLFMHLFEGDENVCPQLILTSFWTFYEIHHFKVKFVRQISSRKSVTFGWKEHHSTVSVRVAWKSSFYDKQINANKPPVCAVAGGLWRSLSLVGIKGFLHDCQCGDAYVTTKSSRMDVPIRLEKIERFFGGVGCKNCCGLVFPTHCTNFTSKIVKLVCPNFPFRTLFPMWKVTFLSANQSSTHQHSHRHLTHQYINKHQHINTWMHQLS
jgi:hypothetical protein